MSFFWFRWVGGKKKKYISHKKEWGQQTPFSPDLSWITPKPPNNICLPPQHVKEELPGKLERKKLGRLTTVHRINKTLVLLNMRKEVYIIVCKRHATVETTSLYDWDGARFTEVTKSTSCFLIAQLCPVWAFTHLLLTIWWSVTTGKQYLSGHWQQLVNSSSVALTKPMLSVLCLHSFFGHQLKWILLTADKQNPASQCLWAWKILIPYHPAEPPFSYVWWDGVLSKVEVVL